MKHLPATISALACALALPAVAIAAAEHTSDKKAHVVTHKATGTVTNIGYSNFTIQLPGRPVGVINALIDRATEITREDYPYVWGGGHAEAGVASIGIPGGPGYNGHRKGFDCSGSVAAVLAGGGLWPAGAGVPNDAGVIEELLDEHLIARGAGTGPNEVTLYDDPGVHIFMNIDGRFFGTSDGGGGGDKKGGPGWLDDSAWDASDRAFKQYHVLPSVLKEKTSDAQAMTFQLGQDPILVNGFADGNKVNVTYTDAKNGTMVAQTVGFYGLRSATGTITALGSKSVTIQTSSGTMKLATKDLPSGLLVGDTVAVTYTRSDDVNTLRSISVTAVAPPTPTPPAGPTGTTGSGYSSTGGAGTNVSHSTRRSSSSSAGTGLPAGAWKGWGGWVHHSRRAAARKSAVPPVSHAAN